MIFFTCNLGKLIRAFSNGKLYSRKAAERTSYATGCLERRLFDFVSLKSQKNTHRIARRTSERAVSAGDIHDSQVQGLEPFLIVLRLPDPSRCSADPSFTSPYHIIHFVAHRGFSLPLPDRGFYLYRWWQGICLQRFKFWQYNPFSHAAFDVARSIILL
jgi:hypothetical protein